MSGIDRSNHLHAVYAWVMYQVRCAPVEYRQRCGKEYKPFSGGMWRPDTLCALRQYHPDSCSVANYKYKFGLNGMGRAPMDDLLALAYQIKDHGEDGCALPMKDCELEVQTLKIELRSNDE
jgi:hypothetical protein